MESKHKVELIQLAIQQLMEDEKRNKRSYSSDENSFVAVDADEDHRLLSRLLSELEKLEGDGKLEQPEPSSAAPEEVLVPAPAACTEEEPPKSESETANGGDGDIGREDIVGELRKVKKQNLITHCLLSVMIVLTVAWQLSEVSLILKIKEGLSHPFRSLGGIFTGFLKHPNVNGQEGEKQESAKQPAIKLPELPHVELPNLNGDEE